MNVAIVFTKLHEDEFSVMFEINYQILFEINDFFENVRLNPGYRPGGERGNGPPEGKFTKLGEKVNFGVLSSKLNVIRAKKGAISLFLTNKTSFSC